MLENAPNTKYILIGCIAVICAILVGFAIGTTSANNSCDKYYADGHTWTDKCNPVAELTLDSFLLAEDTTSDPIFVTFDGSYLSHGLVYLYVPALGKSIYIPAIIFTEATQHTPTSTPTPSPTPTPTPTTYPITNSYSSTNS